MRFTVKTTERDKKLLTGICLVLAVYICCMLVIRPLYAANKGLKEQILKNEVRIEELRQKELSLPEAEAENQKKQGELADICADLYPVMESRQLDRLVTDMVIRHGLTVCRLNISVPEEPADLRAYLQNEGEGSNPEGKYGIYLAQVDVEVTGEREQVDLLINELAADCKAIRIAMIDWRKNGSGPEGQQNVRLRLYVEMYQTDAPDPSAR